MQELQLDDGATLHYQLQGERGPTLVLLNGMTQTTLNWQSQLRHLRKQARVLVYDARGQGKTALGEQEPTLLRHALDLRTLLDTLELDRAHLVGFSHGCRIALSFATQHPERLDHLVLTSATAQPDATARTIIRGWREITRLGGLEALAWASLPIILGHEYLGQAEKMIEPVIRASVERNTEDGIRALLEQMFDYPDLRELAEEVDAPTLVISADQDPLVHPEGARELARLCGGTHKLIEGHGHTLPIEAPRIWREQVVEFLGLG